MRLTWILLPVLAAGVIATGLFVHSNLTRAVHNPVVSIDMDPTGNTYDETTNTMTLGSIEQCLTSATANPAQHNHQTHLVIQNVEDLVGWQVRLNYDGGQMRPLNANVNVFTDNTTGQAVSFLNLPIDAGVHRDQVFAADIPAQAAGPQTALIGNVYNGAQSDPVSPDTPPKAPPDDASYSAPSGGVLAALILQVVGDQSGQASLVMNMDDANPNSPGSDLQIWSGTAVVTESLTPAQLGDGYHGEGATCTPLDCVNFECPGQVVTPTEPPPTPTQQPVTPTATAAPTLPPGVTPTPPPGGGGGTGGATGTRTPAAGAGARTPTPRVTPAALPPTGGSTPTLVTVASIAIFAAGLAAAGSGTVYAIRRLRRDEVS